jgi:DNA-binding transcriptional LysR family regulator
MSDIDALNIRAVDGGLLLVFRELIRQGRVTSAADRLGLSQSGVSHALARLRDIFGDPLFLRRPHGLAPTRRALELAPRIEALIADTQALLGGPAVFDPAASTRQFHIGASDFVTSLVAAPLMERLQAAAPGAQAAFHTLVGEAAFDALRRGEIDLALGRFADAPAPLRADTLFTDRYAVAARAGHPALKGGLTLEDFAAWPHVMIAVGPQPISLSEGVLADLGVRRRVLALAPSFITAFSIVASTDALITAPRPLALRYASRYGLDVAECPFPPPALQVMAVRRATPKEDAAIPWLLDQVKAVAL